MSLEKRQKYYQYERGGFYFKTPPVLDQTIHDELRRIDPTYRFIWGGVAIIRNEPNGTPTQILGDRRATKVNNGRLQPRYFYVKTGKQIGWSFKNKRGNPMFVDREDRIPSYAKELAVAEWEYRDFGKLYWFLEKYLTPEQLIDAGIYNADDPRLPPEGDYICQLMIATPQGLYYEPDMEWLNGVLRKHLYEVQNENLKDLLVKDREIRQKRETERERIKEERADQEFDDMWQRALRAPINPKFFLPSPRTT